MQNYWWKNTIIYELYMQSFKDSNGDGIGDIDGAIEKLPYLKDLGVGAIWLTPIYVSPLEDNGYDIADFKDINPIYGDLKKMKQFIKKAEENNIAIIMDLVLNHTSDEHAWFKESRKDKNNKYRDFYVWRDEPSDLQSSFGGPAWSFDEKTKQWYLHQFSPKQPDLNWENPAVKAEIHKMIKWWCDLGIKGFRLDVIDLIGKEVDKNIFVNGPKLHDNLKEMRQNSWVSSEFLTVGECWGATIEDGLKYSAPQSKELSMIFQFEHVTKFKTSVGKYQATNIEFVEFKKIFEKWQNGLHNNGWNSLFLGNHDLPRMISKYGNDKEFRIPSAKTLFTTMFLMEGTPYIFQGDEIGMTNLYWNDLNEYKDVEIKTKFKSIVLDRKLLTEQEFLEGVKQNGRDNARTPFHWNDKVNAGFSTGKPWIKVNDNYKEINAEKDLKNPQGIYNYLKQLIDFRKYSELSNLIVNGEFKLVDENNKNIFAYRRFLDNQELFVIANWSDNTQKVTIPFKGDVKIHLNTHESFDQQNLQPWQTIVISKK